jgi:hypothetical protein
VDAQSLAGPVSTAAQHANSESGLAVLAALLFSFVFLGFLYFLSVQIAGAIKFLFHRYRHRMNRGPAAAVIATNPAREAAGPPQISRVEPRSAALELTNNLNCV